MARGVSQNEIHSAADDLLATGERPTVERVRAQLGRGSPNTIGPLLDGWWAKLAERLTHRVALPELPVTVGAAFAHLWETAVAAGQVHAEAQVAPERLALADALAKADAAAAAQQLATVHQEAQLLQAQAALRGVEQALAISDQRVSDLLGQVASQKATEQQLIVRRDALESRLGYIQIEHQKERASISAERDALQAHVRQAQDRAYGEVDRLRQELKALKGQLSAQTREHAAALRAGVQGQRAAETEAQRAQREVASLRGRLEALASARPRKPALATALEPRLKRPVAKAAPTLKKRVKAQAKAT